MPLIFITMIEGRSDEKKAAMHKEVTEAVHRTLGAPREAIRIVINEVPAKHFSAAGVPKSDASS